MTERENGCLNHNYDTFNIYSKILLNSEFDFKANDFMYLLNLSGHSEILLCLQTAKGLVT